MKKIILLALLVMPLVCNAKIKIAHISTEAPYCNTLKDLSALADAYKDFALTEVAMLTSSGKCSTIDKDTEIQVVNQSKYGFTEFNTESINNGFIASQYVVE
uniref:hypothetical protein n=1 Tax=Scandinavium goeteborgense TaxID=1851514 RepID=UPI00135C9E5C|nr:hypothetical protein [Scandinavium goeteborgense]